jgi:hypothetical protein
MSFSTAKTTLQAMLEKVGTHSEVEVDGHRVKSRSVEELSQLNRLINDLADVEESGDPVKNSGYKSQLKNNGDGLA